MKKILLLFCFSWSGSVLAMGVSPAVLDVRELTRGETAELCFWLSSQEKRLVELDWSSVPEWMEFSYETKSYDFRVKNQHCVPVKIHTHHLDLGQYEEEVMVKEVFSNKDLNTIHPGLQMKIKLDLIEERHPEITVLQIGEKTMDVMNTGSTSLKNLSFVQKNDKGELFTLNMGDLAFRESKQFSFPARESIRLVSIYEGEILLFEKKFEEKNIAESGTLWWHMCFSVVLVLSSIGVLHFLWFRL